MKSLLFIYSFLLLVYAVFSFSLTDPNLVLLNWQPYWQFQQWMWQTFFSNHQLLAGTFVIIIVALFFVYGKIVTALQKSSAEYQKTTKEYIIIYLLLIAPLLLSYNALSHDVFNYIFNAKMVVVYGANPHQSVALDFATDEWTRFMHNTHTPAPYGYGWTGLSVIPYFVGFGKFLTTWLAFRLWSVLSVVLLFLALQYAAKVFKNLSLQSHQLALLFLNPLFVLEVVGNMHNDLWMLVPAIVSLAILASLNLENLWQKKKIFIFVLLLIVSVSVKYATLVLLPLFILIGLEKRMLNKFVVFLQSKIPFLKTLPAHILENIEHTYYQFIPLLASFFLFVPLFTSRSQQFHPWYLVWVLVWLPFITVGWWRNLILIFSVTSLLRYVPWLLEGEFTDDVLFQQKVITWSAVLIWSVWYFGLKKKTRNKINKLSIVK